MWIDSDCFAGLSIQIRHSPSGQVSLRPQTTNHSCTLLFATCAVGEGVERIVGIIVGVCSVNVGGDSDKFSCVLSFDIRTVGEGVEISVVTVSASSVNAGEVSGNASCPLQADKKQKNKISSLATNFIVL
jgi:hypothetical protein